MYPAPQNSTRGMNPRRQSHAGEARKTRDFAMVCPPTGAQIGRVGRSSRMSDTITVVAVKATRCRAPQPVAQPEREFCMPSRGGSAELEELNEPP